MTNSEVIEMLESEWRDRLKAAVLAEREAILDLVDGYAKSNTDLADAIRARGQS